MASPRRYRQPRAQRLETGTTTTNGIPRQSATSRRDHGSDSGGAGVGEGGTFKSRMGRLLTRRSSIAGILACLFLLAAVGNFHWAEMEQRAHDTRENGSDNSIYGGGYGFRQKLDGSGDDGDHNNNDDDDDDDDDDGSGREKSNTAARGGGGNREDGLSKDGNAAAGNREDGLSKDGNAAAGNAAGSNAGKESERASGRSEYGLLNWRRYSWSGLQGESALSQDKAVDAAAAAATVPGTADAAAAAKSTALLVALDDGPRGEIELQMWSEFARSAQERSRAAALGPEGNEGRNGGGGRRRDSSKGWSWRWGGISSKGEKEGAAAGGGVREGSPEVSEAEGREGDDGRSHFPPVWILTSDPAVDRAIREGMPHLLSFFVPGALGDPDTPEAVVAVAGGGVARTSSASVAAEAAVEAGARAEASRLKGETAAAVAKAPPPPPPAGHAADGLANRGRRTTTTTATAAAAVDQQQRQPGAEAEEERQTTGATGAATATKEARAPPQTQTGEGEEEGAPPSRRRASTSEAGGGGGAGRNSPEFSTWSAVLERFLSENPGVDVFGIFGEGSLPTAALLPPAPALAATTGADGTFGHRSGVGVDRIGGGGSGGGSSGRVIESLLWPVLSKSIPPTVVLSRARGWWMHEKEEGGGGGERENGGAWGGGGGAGEWMSDRFVAQVWCNRPMLATARRRGTGLADPEPTTGDAQTIPVSSFLHVIRGLLEDAAGAVGAVLVDGTGAVPSRYLCGGGGGVGGAADCVRRTGDLERVPSQSAGGDSSGGGGGSGGSGGDGTGGGTGGGGDASGGKEDAAAVAAAAVSKRAGSPALDTSSLGTDSGGGGSNQPAPSDEVVLIRPGGSMVEPPPEESLADGFWEGGARAAGNDGDERVGGSSGGSRRKLAARSSGNADPAPGGEGFPGALLPRRKLWFGWWRAKEEPAGGFGVGEAAGTGADVVPELAAPVGAPSHSSADGRLDEEPPEGAESGQEETEEKEEEEEEKEKELVYLQLLAQNALKNLEQQEQERQQHQEHNAAPPPAGDPSSTGTGIITATDDAPPPLPEADFYIGALELALAFEADYPHPASSASQPDAQNATRNLTLKVPDGVGGTGDGSGVGGGGYGEEMVTIAAAAGAPVGKIVAAPWPPSYLLEHVVQSRSAVAAEEEAVAGSSGLGHAGGGVGGGDGGREGRGMVVVTSVNCGYLDMAVNFLLSVRRAGGDVKVLFVAMDVASFDFLDALAPGCAALFPQKLTERRHAVKAGQWGDAIFKHATLVRPDILLAVMGQGYKVLWTDVDIVWLGNPIPLLPDTRRNATAAEVMLQLDGKPVNKCTCFMYLDCTPNAILLLELWKREIVDTGVAQNQMAFRRPLIEMEAAGLNLELLPDEVMPPGFKIFDEVFMEENYERYKDRLLMVHNNWIIGHDPKRERFQKSGLWEVDDWEFPTCQRRRNRRL